MITETELRDYIRAWVREYGQGGLPNEKTTNLIQTLIDHQGFVPSKRGYVGVPLNTIADEVENAVRAMQSTPGSSGDENICFKAATVLRAYYLTPKHWPEEERIDRLKRIGLPMSRHSYYRFVQIGRAFLMGYLNPAKKEVA